MTPDEIFAGARTVADVAAHFQRLRPVCLELADAATATRRGYFTPFEDERVRQLLISYWHSRCALLELVTSFRTDGQLSEELRPAAFLVAFSGACLLVDAARFLRETFHDRPVVRHKLNEPEPYFSIPAGTYDTVQKSLTHPLHAWHLYHALRYFDEHRGDLEALADDPLLAPAWASLAQRAQRVRVSLGSYVRTRAQVKGRSTATHLGRDLLGRALYGMQKLCSSLMADRYVRHGHQPLLPEAIRAHLAGVLLPGDVLVVRKEYALTNYFLPGYWPHAALYLGDPEALRRLGLHEHEHVRPRWARLLERTGEQPRRVLEAMKDGVRIRPVDSPFGCDSIVVLRPRLSPELVGEALARGLFHEGKPYDFDFDFSRSDRLVCTEVVYRAFDGVGGIELPLTRRAGRATLAAGDLIRASLQTPFFQPLLVFSPRVSDQPLTGAQAVELLREKEGRAPLPNA